MTDYPQLLAASLLGSAYLCTGLTGASEPVMHAGDLPIDICFQHGCARQARVHLDQAILTRLAQFFSDATAGPIQERDAIAQAIAQLEQYVGAHSGTDHDLGGTFPGAFQHGQMDCIDEATNTTRYLLLFARQGWLHWHDPSDTATRLPIPRSWWPHTTAVVRERATGREFAVDSWFESNGRPPYVVELSAWRRGWKPSVHQP